MCDNGDGDTATIFNDSHVENVSKEAYLKRKRCQKEVRALIYLSNTILETANSDFPWEMEIDKLEVEFIENCFFGLKELGENSQNLRTEDFGKLCGSQIIPSRILDCSLLQLTIDFSCKTDKQYGEIIGYSIPSDFMTEFLEGKRNGPALCMALSRASFYLSGDVLLFPYVRNCHWSIVGVYVRERVIVHCDSMATRDSKEDKTIFSAILQCIEKFYAHEHISINVKNFKLIPLHDAGLQQQQDVASSAFFTVVFAYSMLSFKDLTIEKESLPSIRYWVAQLAH